MFINVSKNIMSLKMKDRMLNKFKCLLPNCKTIFWNKVEQQKLYLESDKNEITMTFFIPGDSKVRH